MVYYYSTTTDDLVHVKSIYITHDLSGHVTGGLDHVLYLMADKAT